MEGFKSVTKEEFDQWIAAYPGKLERDVKRFYEPPVVVFYDWSRSDPNKGGSLQEALVGYFTHDWFEKPPVGKNHMIRQGGLEQRLREEKP